MKKLFLFFIGFLIMIPTIASAHTQLNTSNPAENSVVTEELREIVLTFEGKVEPLSKMKLLKDGTEVVFEKFEIKEKQMIGSLSDTLANGSYIIQWNIVGEDGHPIKGEIPFNVQIEQTNVEQEHNEETPEKSKENVKADSKLNDKSSETTKEKDTNGMNVFIPVIVVVVLGFLLLALFKKKK